MRQSGLKDGRIRCGDGYELEVSGMGCGVENRNSSSVSGLEVEGLKSGVLGRKILLFLIETTYIAS